MKLSKRDKMELRKKIFKYLKYVPSGEMIKIHKDILEELLFEVVIVDKEQQIVVKLPVWSGTFLRKIDLSEVDFSYVSWDLSYWILQYFEKDSDTYKLVKSIVNKFSDVGIKYLINYAGTNANIDLTTSFSAKHDHSIIIRNCIFSGLDFSKFNLESIDLLRVVSSNISDTNLIIPSGLTFTANDSNLSGIDLSSRTINAKYCYERSEHDFTECNLIDTGINIVLDKNDLKYEYIKKFLKNVVFNKWIGCYVNGKKILSPEKQAANKEELKAQYEQMKKEIFDSVLTSIDEHAKQKKKV